MFMKGFGPDGAIMSTDNDDDGKTSANAAVDDGEDLEIEIETFSNDTSVGKQDRVDDAAIILSRAVPCSSGDTMSLPSIKTTGADDRRLSLPDKERGQEI